MFIIKGGRVHVLKILKIYLDNYKFRFRFSVLIFDIKILDLLNQFLSIYCASLLQLTSYLPLKLSLSTN